MRTPRPARKQKPPKRWRLVWKGGGQPVFLDAAGNDVRAQTRSEARALFKEKTKFSPADHTSFHPDMAVIEIREDATRPALAPRPDDNEEETP
jgi:hypothetical protein